MAPLVVHLPERSMITISGPDAQSFLQGLVTTDVRQLDIGKAAYGALLAPQGKILFDFFLIREEADSYLLDCPRSQHDALEKRLQFYKLRARIDIATDQERAVHAVVEGSAAGVVEDPRPADIGGRLYANRLPAAAASDEYHRRRIAAGFAEGGMDYQSGELFPHEVNLDQIGGLSFEKGCFIGQEVVSRMEHRGTTRSRVLPCRTDGKLPAMGSNVVSGERTLGRVLSGAGEHILALVRLDRLADSLANGSRPSAEGIALEPRLPEWARFTMPTAAEPAA